MAEINKVDLNLNTKIANPFKTSRNSNSTTNPFKNVNFEGKTLDVEIFADVFEHKSTNKLRMISSSVAGSMTKVRTGITESITNFVNRVRSGINSVKEMPAIKSFNETMNKDIVVLGKDFAHSISDSVSGMGNRLSEKLAFLNEDIDLSGIGKGLSEKWTAMISNIHLHHDRVHVPKNASVEEYRTLWIGINEKMALAEREAA